MEGFIEWKEKEEKHWSSLLLMNILKKAESPKTQRLFPVGFLSVFFWNLVKSGRFSRALNSSSGVSCEVNTQFDPPQLCLEQRDLCGFHQQLVIGSLVFNEG